MVCSGAGVEMRSGEAGFGVLHLMPFTLENLLPKDHAPTDPRAHGPTTFSKKTEPFVPRLKALERMPRSRMVSCAACKERCMPSDPVSVRINTAGSMTTSFSCASMQSHAALACTQMQGKARRIKLALA